MSTRATGTLPRRAMPSASGWARCGTSAKVVKYINECREMGIKVLPPDVNSSDWNFTPSGDAIRFGLGAVRNLGQDGEVHQRVPRDGHQSPAARCQLERLELYPVGRCHPLRVGRGAEPRPRW